MKEISRQIMFAVLERFFEGNANESKATNIAEYINRTFHPDPKFNRESIYPIIRKAKSMGFLQIYPPLDATLSKEIADAYRQDPDDIVVVKIEKYPYARYVAYQAAVETIKLMKELRSSYTRHEKSIGLGLGPGHATLDFCKSLSSLIRNEIDIPRISLYAISTGSPIDQPEYAPISFFNLFSNSYVDKRYGFFAESIVPQHFFDEIKRRPLLSELFQQKEDIDIVVTSMGDKDDEHDLLRNLMVKSGWKESDFKKRGWAGNVQFRPYTLEGPIRETSDELRAVTLFELDDFVRMAERKKKHVVLLARQCSRCGRDRSASLRPLLENPALKVWSKLIMDIPTAKGLIAGRSAPR